MSATHFSGPVESTAGFRPGTASVENITGAKTLVAADSGKTFFLNAAGGAAVTLPDVTIAGLRFEIMVGALFASTNWVVSSAEGDNIDGSVEVAGAVVVAAAEDQINFVASAESLGDRIFLISDGVQWFVSGTAAASGGITVTDPS